MPVLSELLREPVQRATSETDLLEHRSARSGRSLRACCRESPGASPEPWTSERVEEQVWALSRLPVRADCRP